MVVALQPVQTEGNRGIAPVQIKEATATQALSKILTGVSLDAKKGLRSYYERKSGELSREAEGRKRERKGRPTGNKYRVIMTGRAMGYRNMAAETDEPKERAVQVLDSEVRTALYLYFMGMAHRAEMAVPLRSRMDLFVSLAAPREAYFAAEGKKGNLPLDDYFKKVGEESAFRITAKHLGVIIQLEESFRSIKK